jgi:hypothetical protein
MGVIEGTKGLKRWKGSYDFAVDGGAVSTIALRSEDGQLPNGAVVMGGFVKVTTPLTSGGAGTGGAAGRSCERHRQRGGCFRRAVVDRWAQERHPGVHRRDDRRDDGRA